MRASTLGQNSANVTQSDPSELRPLRAFPSSYLSYNRCLWVPALSSPPRQLPPLSGHSLLPTSPVPCPVLTPRRTLDPRP
eukprot:1259878-Rhodomonas_salina.1